MVPEAILRAPRRTGGTGRRGGPEASAQGPAEFPLKVCRRRPRALHELPPKADARRCAGRKHYPVKSRMLTPGLQRLLADLDVQPVDGRSILIVDDDPEVRTVLEMLLCDCGDVRVAEDGPTALRMLAEAPADLVLSDQRMPHMTGVELLEVVARLMPDSIRVVLTAFSDVGPIVTAINRGAVSRFLLKPWNEKHLRETVTELLELRQAQLTVAELSRTLERRHADLADTLRELEHTQNRLISSEQRASLAWLTRGLHDELESMMMLVRTLIDTVEARSDAPSLVEHARTAARAANTLINQVRNVHNFAESKPILVNPTPVDTHQFLGDLAAIFAKEALGRGRRVDVEIDLGLFLLVLDRDQLGQALLALLRNGAQASDPDRLLRVRVYMARGGTPCFEVTDQGIGMDADEVRRCTDAFVSRWPAPGLGIGLSLARMIAEAHEGQLEVLSRPGRGTAVRLYLASNHDWDMML
jgi:signal transduction histidine kinase